MLEIALLYIRSKFLRWTVSLCDLLLLPLINQFHLFTKNILRLYYNQIKFKTHNISQFQQLVKIANDRFLKSKYSSLALKYICPYDHQVAGHTKEALLKLKDLILKPKIKDETMANEIK